MGETKARRIILFVLLAFLFVPLIQHKFLVFQVDKLKGAVVTNADTSFTLSSWWNGTYQQQKTLFLNDDEALRPTLVRLNNQFDYSIFQKVHAREVVLGKDDYLFENAYINEYYGLDYLGDEEVNREIGMLKKIQDTLERLGKTFVYVYGGSKAYYYPDKLPSDRKPQNRPAKTNYSEFRRLGDSVGLHQVDFNSWIVSKKDTSRFLLYNRQGTHWTVYGSLLATDSLIRYIEKRRSIITPEIAWNTVKVSDTAQGTDDDIASGLNLFTKLKKENMAYPDVYYRHDGTRTRPKAIYIGDSYMWTLLRDHLMQEVNSDFYVWYYFVDSHTLKSLRGEEPMQPVADIDWAGALEKTECVIVMYSPPNFKGFSYHGAFLYQIYEHFYPPQK